jgi:hypothetical protein
MANIPSLDSHPRTSTDKTARYPKKEAKSQSLEEERTQFPRPRWDMKRPKGRSKTVANRTKTATIKGHLSRIFHLCCLIESVNRQARVNQKRWTRYISDREKTEKSNR